MKLISFDLFWKRGYSSATKIRCLNLTRTNTVDVTGYFFSWKDKTPRISSQKLVHTVKVFSCLYLHRLWSRMQAAREVGARQPIRTHQMGMPIIEDLDGRRLD